MATTANFYETDKAISEYLLFHYGNPDLFNGPPKALDFAKRCADLAQRHALTFGRALDLGCAVGRSACELSVHFEETIGIDFSHGLIEAAERIRQGARIEAQIATEGELFEIITLARPHATRPERLSFQQGDAMALPPHVGTFDFVLMANLIDRLPDPSRCLRTTGSIVNPGGILAITSPYTWLEAYTPKEKWLGGYMQGEAPVRSYETLHKILSPDFEELEALDLPFLIREHSRKNQYSIAQATLWRKR